MNTDDLRARAPERGIAQDSDRAAAHGRSSSLMVAGISLAIFGAVLTAASAADHMLPMALGLGLFIAGAAIGVAFATNLPHSTLSARQSDVERSEDNANGASMPWSFRDSIASMQFGPDPEQVIGRQTGART